MSNKSFVALIVIAIIGFGGFIVYDNSNEPAKLPRPGIAQAEKESKHVAQGTIKYDGDTPPTSGNHAEALPWQFYGTAIPDDNVIHNLEHGGIYISYNPNLPKEQIAKIQSLFFTPFTKDKFTPTKAIAAPRENNKAPIVLSSWNRTLELQVFDEAVMVEYYLQNIGKSPEPTAS